MSRLPFVARLLLGLIFTAFGIMGLLQLGPQPELEGKAADFMGGLVGSDYFWQVLKVTEIVCGLLLLAGVATPLALVILAPVTVNIVLFHIFLDPATIVVGIVLCTGASYWTRLLAKFRDLGYEKRDDAGS